VKGIIPEASRRYVTVDPFGWSRARRSSSARYGYMRSSIISTSSLNVGLVCSRWRAPTRILLG
jgi:hypothetical protein